MELKIDNAARQPFPTAYIARDSKIHVDDAECTGEAERVFMVHRKEKIVHKYKTIHSELLDA